MKKGSILFIVVIAVVAVAIFMFTDSTTETSADKTDVRIGWQIPWATEGQLTQVLKNTDLLDDQGLNGEFKGFSYGGPLNEAALAGEVDVIFTADQPAATLLSKDSEWTIIARLMYNRVSLYVPPESPIVEISDLRDKTVAMPFGAAAQRMALAVQQEAGLDPQTDVNNINLGIYEQSDLVQSVDAAKWGDIDAMAGFDPTPAIFEEKGLVRNLHVGKIVSVIVMSNEFIAEHPEAPEKFLQAFFDAYDYYRLNIEQANAWFTEEAGLDMTPGALDIAARIEPNVYATSRDDIRIDFNEEDRVIMQEAADFIYDQELVTTQVTMNDFINTDYLENVK